jgi:hypothetical protein
MNKEELEKLYYSNNNDVVAKRLGMSVVTLNKIIKQAGIKQKGKGYNAGKKINFKLEL